MSNIHERLKKIRISRGLSLREAAKRSQLSHSYIDILEKGIHPNSGAPVKPSPDSLKALAKAYNCDYEELMRVSGYIKEDIADPVDKLIEYLELELTDEEIIERMSFKIDGMELSDEDIKEFIAFVRAKRFMKSGQRPSRTEGP